MHFCFINLPIEFYSPISGGAISTIIAEISQELLKEGHRVTVLTRHDGNPLHPHGEAIVLGACGREDLHFLQRRWSHLRSKVERWDWCYYDYYREAVVRGLREMGEEPDVVFVFNDLQSPVFLRRSLPNSKICVWLQNEQGTNSKDLGPAIDATDWWFTCSSYIRDWTIAKHRLPPDRVRTAASGVNLDQFKPRDGFEQPGGKTRVLFVGRIDPNKGPDLALDAVIALQKQSLPVTMTVVGSRWFYANSPVVESPYEADLREKARIANAETPGHVSRDKIGDVFRGHDVVCVLSRSNEPFGLVVLEAMASGCAVIASDRGGLPEACGDAGFLVEVDDPASIESTLKTLVLDHRKLAEAKRAAVARATRSPWRETASRLQEAIGAVNVPRSIDPEIHQYAKAIARVAS